MEEKKSEVKRTFPTGMYAEKKITGLEGYCAMRLCFQKWYELTGNEYLEWLIDQMFSDYALLQDWEESVKKIIEDRVLDTDVPQDYPFNLVKARYKPCKCEQEEHNSTKEN